MLDRIGRELRAGQRILFVTTEGRNAVIRFATVLVVEGRPEGYQRKLVEKCQVQADPMPLMYDGQKPHEFKPVWLSISRRIFIIADSPDDTIPGL